MLLGDHWKHLSNVLVLRKLSLCALKSRNSSTFLGHHNLQRAITSRKQNHLVRRALSSLTAFLRDRRFQNTANEQPTSSKDEPTKDESNASENEKKKENPFGFFTAPSKSSNRKNQQGKPSKNVLLYIGGFVLGVIVLLHLESKTKLSFHKANKEITFQQFVQSHLAAGTVDHLEYDKLSNEVYVYLRKDGSVSSGEDTNYEDQLASQSNIRRNIMVDKSSDPLGFDFYFSALGINNLEEKLAEAEERLRIPPSRSTKILVREEFNFAGVIASILETALVIGGIIFLTRRGKGGMLDMFNVSKVGVRTDHKVTVTFKDVAGMEEAKAEIAEFVSLLKDPNTYLKLGAKIPRGAILMGPPGTGKTLLAKAVAGETSVPFFSISGSDFVEMFVGVGPARVRDLFSRARQHKRAIIFIDEIDAIARPRGLNSMYGGGSDERESTLNQLLVEMDGFNENSSIIVLASTNVDRDGLDQALLRPGRFDRQIVIDKPDLKDREQIFAVHLKPLQVADEVASRITRLAELTPGFTGADIMNVCNEAGIYAARDNLDKIEVLHVERAIERVMGGLEKKNAPIMPEEKRIIAFHEAGHAIVSWFLKNCDPLLKLSIIPRGKALGYAQYVPQERFIRTTEQLMDLITQAMGGRVAEKIIFNHLSTGAHDDLQKITRIAYAAVSTFGMSTVIGPISYPIPGDPSISIQKPYSEDTAKAIDEEVRKLINEAFERAEQLLRERLPLLHQVAEYLIKHEVMPMEKFKEMAGERPKPVLDTQQQ